MGTQFCSTSAHLNMKALLLGALATVAGLAAAEPEAEAEASIGPGYGYLYYPYYYGHGYAPLKPPSIENIDYGKTGIKYLKKRSADAEPEAEAFGYFRYPFPPYYYPHYGYTLVKPPSTANVDYGKTEIKYLTKRSADAETDAGIKREAEPMDEGAGPAAGLYPYYGYYNRGLYPYGYRYGYPYHALGKRDTAEAASGPNPYAL